MVTTSPDALRAAVANHPHDDTPALALADYYDELGTERAPCDHCGGGRPGEWAYPIDEKGRCITCRGSGRSAKTYRDLAFDTRIAVANRRVCLNPGADWARLEFAGVLETYAGPVAACERCDGTGVRRDLPIPLESWDHHECLTCRGTGSVPDGRAIRAEFVRVGVALAKLLDGWKPETWSNLDMYLDPQDSEDQEWKHKVYDLWRREKELRARHGRGWLAGSPLEKYDLIWDDWMTWSRGFPSSLTLDWPALRDHGDNLMVSAGECPRVKFKVVEGTVSPETRRRKDGASPCPSWCPHCSGTGRITRPCPPTACPIEVVTLTTWPVVGELEVGWATPLVSALSAHWPMVKTWNLPRVEENRIMNGDPAIGVPRGIINASGG